MTADRGVGCAGEPRRLLLLRHARAAAAPGLIDLERPLVARGERDSAAVGRWLRDGGRDRGVQPDLVVCSTALRARQTWSIVAGELVDPPEVRYDERVYGADAATLLGVVRETDDAVRTLLVVGHNPAVGELAASLTADARVEKGFPAAGLAVIEAPGGWASLGAGAAALASFVAPDG